MDENDSKIENKKNKIPKKVLLLAETRLKLTLNKVVNRFFLWNILCFFSLSLLSCSRHACH